MPAPYSLDLRLKAISAYENEEGTQAEISERFMICETTLWLWLKAKNKTGRINPKEHIYRGRKIILDGENLEFIKELVSKKPDILIKEIQELYRKKFKADVAQSMVSRAFKRLNLRRKKKSLYAQEQDREDIKKKRTLARRNDEN